MCLPTNPFKIEREWESNGLKCAVVLAREAGHRCGYVRVPPKHPAHGRHYNLVDVDVHGGLTFAKLEPCSHEDGQGWWLGFDCAHFGDALFNLDDNTALDPETRRIFALTRKIQARLHKNEHYWLEAEVVAETERLAEQLSKMTKVEVHP